MTAQILDAKAAGAAISSELNGAHAVVVGRGITVGRSIGLRPTRRSENATVTTCHTGTRVRSAHLRGADVSVAAAGVPHLVKPEDAKPRTAVPDVGVSRTAARLTGDAGLTGDVDPGVAEGAGWLSSNPGGVGPMTRAMLLANGVVAAERAAAS